MSDLEIYQGGVDRYDPYDYAIEPIVHPNVQASLGARAILVLPEERLVPGDEPVRVDEEVEAAYDELAREVSDQNNAEMLAAQDAEWARYLAVFSPYCARVTIDARASLYDVPALVWRASSPHSLTGIWQSESFGEEGRLHIPLIFLLGLPVLNW